MNSSTGGWSIMRSSRMVVSLAAGAVVLSACLANSPDESVVVSDESPTTSVAVTSGAQGQISAGEGIHAASGLGDPLYPHLGNAGYDVQHVSLSLRLDTSSGRLTGQSEIEAVALDDLDSWSIDLATVFASEVRVDGQPALWEADGGELRIDPDEVVPRGATFTMSIAYSGLSEPFDSVAATFTTGLQRSADGFFVLSEPDGTSSWMPVNDHPLDKATYTLSFAVPGPLVVAASGELRDVESGTDGFFTYTFDVQEPIAPYLIAFAVGDFLLEEEEGPDGIAIRNYFDSDLRSSSLAPFSKQATMIEFLTERFGPYPFASYGALVLETSDVAVALETQTLSTFGRQSLGLGEDVVIHELAHQWFGDSVSVENWDDIWINEGYATYAQWLWTEETRGPEFRDVSIAQAYELISGRVFLSSAAESVAAAQAYRQFPPAGSPNPDDLFNLTIYFRGGLTLHALRLEVGDDAFFEIAKRYQSDFKHGNASTQDFIDLASEVAGLDMTGFFNAWLFDEAMPPIPELGLAPLSR